MDASQFLTGYSSSHFSLFNVPSPGTCDEDLFSSLLDKYVDQETCTYDGWEVPSKSTGAYSVDDVDSQPTLQGSNLFSRLPWFKAAFCEVFDTPHGLTKVQLSRLFVD